MNRFRRALSKVGRILNTKLYETPAWFVYLPFAAHLFNATLCLCAAPVGIWWSWQWRMTGSEIMRSVNATPSDPVARFLFWMPLGYLALSIAGLVFGVLALRAARREWQKLKATRGFDVLPPYDRS